MLLYRAGLNEPDFHVVENRFSTPACKCGFSGSEKEDLPWRAETAIFRSAEKSRSRVGLKSRFLGELNSRSSAVD